MAGGKGNFSEMASRDTKSGDTPLLDPTHSTEGAQRQGKEFQPKGPPTEKKGVLKTMLNDARAHLRFAAIPSEGIPVDNFNRMHNIKSDPEEATPAEKDEETQHKNSLPEGQSREAGLIKKEKAELEKTKKEDHRTTSRKIRDWLKKNPRIPFTEREFGMTNRQIFTAIITFIAVVGISVICAVCIPPPAGPIIGGILGGAVFGAVNIFCGVGLLRSKEIAKLKAELDETKADLEEAKSQIDKNSQELAEMKEQLQLLLEAKKDDISKDPKDPPNGPPPPSYEEVTGDNQQKEDEQNTGEHQSTDPDNKELEAQQGELQATEPEAESGIPQGQHEKDDPQGKDQKAEGSDEVTSTPHSKNVGQQHTSQEDKMKDIDLREVTKALATAEAKTSGTGEVDTQTQQQFKSDAALNSAKSTEHVSQTM